MADVVISKKELEGLERWKAKAKELMGPSEGRRTETAGGIELFKTGTGVWEKGKGAAMIGASHGLMDLLVGGGVYALATMKSISENSYIKSYWYARPALLGLLGWFMYRKGYAIAGAVLGTAAALFVHAYKFQQTLKPGYTANADKEVDTGEEAAFPWQRDRWEEPRGERRLEGEERRIREAERTGRRVYDVAA